MKTNRNQNSLQTAVIEAIESRRMMSASASLGSDGILTIQGTNEADNITVSKSGSSLKVKLDSSNTKTYEYSKVKKVIAWLYDKGDTYTSFNEVKISMEVHGGNNYDTITTGGGRDTLYGDANWDQLNGGDSVDLFYGGTGNDTCHGGNDMDIFVDEAGKDEYYGEAGDDQLTMDTKIFTEADLFDGGEGIYDMVSYWVGRNDPIRVTLDGVANDGYFGNKSTGTIEADNIMSNVEQVVGTKKGDYIEGFGNVNNTFRANEGNDTLKGGDGNDTIGGDEGDDLIYGGNGNDYLTGYTDNDTLYGGNGYDTLTGGYGIDMLFGGAQSDKLHSATSDPGEIVDGGSGYDYADPDMLGNLVIDALISIEELTWI